MRATKIKTETIGKTAVGAVPHAHVLARALLDDEFARAWEELAPARAVAAKVIEYRADHALSQRDLALRLGIPQPQVARIEGGEHDPSLKTLTRLSSALGLEFNIDIAPAEREPKLVTKSARTTHLAARYERNNSVVRFATGPTPARASAR